SDYASAVLHGTPLLAPGEDGIRGLTISNAIHYSAWTGEWADIDNFPHEKFYRLLQEKIKNSNVKKKERQFIADTQSSYNI
ncbi:MAG: gfo/Idh/MocA family oxidoreductase, partial [Ruthenibacterium sp.]